MARPAVIQSQHWPWAAAPGLWDLSFRWWGQRPGPRHATRSSLPSVGGVVVAVADGAAAGPWACGSFHHLQPAAPRTGLASLEWDPGRHRTGKITLLVQVRGRQEEVLGVNPCAGLSLGQF